MEITTYSEVNPQSQTVNWVAEPILPDSPELVRVFERHMHEHSPTNHHRRTRDGRAVKLSDFLTRSEFHQLALYNEFYRRIGLEYEMVATILPSSRLRSTGVVGTSPRETVTSSTCSVPT